MCLRPALSWSRPEISETKEKPRPDFFEAKTTFFALKLSSRSERDLKDPTPVYTDHSDYQ